MTNNSGRNPTAAPLKLRWKDLVLLAIPLLGFQILLLHHQTLSPTHPDAESHRPNDYLQLSMESNERKLAKGMPKRRPDGEFNGYPVYLQRGAPQANNSALHTSIHCIGETYSKGLYQKRKRAYIEMAWADRSCHFEFFCFDLDTKEYVIFPPNHTDASPSAHVDTHQTIYNNQSVQGHPFEMSLGGVNTKWTLEAYPRVKWFPQVRYETPTEFYALPANVAMVPFHSLSASNPGHLVWDDFLPIYTLLHVFQLDQSLELLMMRYQLPGEGLWASCDWKKERSQECAFMLKKFGPLMVRNPNAIPIRTQNLSELTLAATSGTNEAPKSNLVCARHGLGGLGSLTDHGSVKGHGWELIDYETNYNAGRGGQLWRFRNFMLRNLGVATSTKPPGPKFRIFFSERSSKTAHRSLDFTKQIRALNESGILDAGDVSIESYRMKEFSVREQAEMVGQAAMYVTGCGGGAVTATFLPRGSSVVLYYGEYGGLANGAKSKTPARLDWDYFNNMAYSRVHWIPKERKDLVVGQTLLVSLVEHEVSLFRQQWADYQKQQSPK